MQFDLVEIPMGSPSRGLALHNNLQICDQYIVFFECKMTERLQCSFVNLKLWSNLIRTLF